MSEYGAESFMEAAFYIAIVVIGLFLSRRRRPMARFRKSFKGYFRHDN